MGADPLHGLEQDIGEEWGNARGWRRCGLGFRGGRLSSRILQVGARPKCQQTRKHLLCGGNLELEGLGCSSGSTDAIASLSQT